MHPVFSADFFASAEQDAGDTSKDAFWLECPNEAEMKKMWQTKADPESSRRVSLDYFLMKDKMGDRLPVLIKLSKWKEKKLKEPKSDVKQRRFLPSRVLRDSFTQSAYSQIMIASFLHWNLGRLNMPADDNNKLSTDQYLDLFMVGINKYSSRGIFKAQDKKFKTNWARPRALQGFQGLDPCSDTKTTIGLLKLTLAVSAADI